MRDTVSFVGRHLSCWWFFFLFAASPLWAQQGPPLELGSPVGGGVRQNAPDLLVGRLERVRNNNNGAYRMALLNPNEQVVAFLAPTGRYDLREFVGQEVSVTAKSSSLSDGGIPYVLIDTLGANTGSGQWVPDRVGSSLSPADQVAQPREPGRMVAPATATVPAKENPVRNVAFEQPGEIQPSCHNGVCGTVVSDAAVVDDGLAGEGWGVIEGTVGCSQCSSGLAGGVLCGNCSGPAYHGLDCQIPGCRCRVATACLPQQPTCGPPGWLWVRGEYLLWWGKGMNTPPLITTTNGGPPQDAGVLGPGSTSQTLYGDEEILIDSNSGFRIRFGGFFGPRRKLGYDGEFLSLTSNADTFTASTDDFAILARPFFNINPRVDGDGALLPPARNDSQLVSYPGIITGTVTVNSFSDFEAAAIRARWNICCKQCCDSCGSGGRCGCRRCGYPPFCRIDFLAGYRHYKLDEGLMIDESLRAVSGETFDIRDSFDTGNEFNGAELGFAWDAGWNRWTLEFMTNIALGNTEQAVSIDGSTISATPGATPETFTGGLLAQESNIGTYSRDTFTMIPSLNLNLGFYLTPRFRFIVGYSLLYWGGVVRPGDQVDLDLNPDFLPPAIVNSPGADRPEFAFQETDYWIQGLNLGLDYRW